MPATKPFRFGVVAAAAASGDEWIAAARRAEDLGYAILLVPDNLQYTLAPFPALAAAAAGTRSLRIGTYVLANDYRHPVLLAKDAATLDVISGGRFELGIGAGRPSAAADNAMLGLPFDAGSARARRLAEALQILRPLLGGERVNMDGGAYAVNDAAIAPLPFQRPLPLLVAAGRRRMLALAAQQADIVALGLPPETTGEQMVRVIGWIREAAGERFARLELNLNLMAVGGQVPAYLAATLGRGAEALARSDALSVLRGATEEMCERLHRVRDEFGISYIAVSDELAGGLAPVVARLRGR
jgi:probable F420-dependent oxidoreductase